MSTYFFRVTRIALRSLANSSLRKPNLSLTARKFHLGRRTMVRFITQTVAQAVDQELFHVYKFSLEQLMELAGLACASAIYKCYGVNEYQSVVVLCGPGNNGGDGLVCARHLKMFGFNPEIYYPRHNKLAHFQNLVEQCKAMDIPILETMPNLDSYALVIDAVFGFSFKSPVRIDFQEIITKLCCTTTKIASIDIPSGWDVDGYFVPDSFMPDMLISLTAPKKGAFRFSGRYHFLAGRFVPPSLAAAHNLCLPNFQGTECCIDITGCKDVPEGASL